MIKLTKNASNDVTVTLTEKTTVTNPIYLWEFISDQTKNSYTVISTDVSTALERYNRFSIVEGTDDRLNGKVILGNAGYYHYIVREQTSTTNLDVSLSGAIVEKGKMLLEDGTTYYNENDIAVNYDVYEPN